LTSFGLVQVAHRWRWLRWVITAWFVVVGIVTWRSYFVHWPTEVDLARLFRSERAQQAQVIQTVVAQGRVVYLPQVDYADEPLHYYLLGHFPPRPVSTFTETADAITFLGDSTTTAWVRFSPGEALILPHRSSEDGLLAWSQPQLLPAHQFGAARLVAATFAPVIDAAWLDVTLFWQAAAQMDADYAVLLHLVDDSGRGWSEDALSRGKVYPTSHWQPEIDEVPNYHRLVLPEAPPVGRYWLAVSVFDRVLGQRLPLTAVDGADLSSLPSPDTAYLGPLKVSLPEPATPPAIATEATFAEVGRLIGYTLNQPHLHQGEPLTVDLRWQATAPSQVDYTVFVHLLDQAGTWHSGHDSQPVNGSYPTTIWGVGERIADLHTLDTTAVPSGLYRLAVGLYQAETGQRVPVMGGEHGQVVLETLIEISGE
jgi:hypothetical protein